MFERMLSGSRGGFVRIAYGILRNQEDAEDAVQDALLSCYMHLRSFEGRSALKTWFTRVVVNAALMIRRKRKPGQVESATAWAPEEGAHWMDHIPSPEPDPEMCYAKAESVGAIRKLIANLRPPLRQCLTMCCLEEMPIHQARTSLGVSKATFKARLFRARRQLISQARRSLSDRSSRTTPYASPTQAIAAATPAGVGS
jgi:RNA polymerase sigma-70 factor (ECF subfamily)